VGLTLRGRAGEATRAHPLAVPVTIAITGAAALGAAGVVRRGGPVPVGLRDLLSRGGKTAIIVLGLVWAARLAALV
jgi:hypothetical protein